MAAVDQAPDNESKGYRAGTCDGYVAARNRLLGRLREARLRNFVSLGGATHEFSQR
jgi:phosphodiesterase/alkaline phosphatase D-like protein